MDQILPDSGLTNISKTIELKTHFSKHMIEAILQRGSTFPKISQVVENQTIITQLRNLEDTQYLESFFENIVKKEEEIQFFYEEKNSLDTLEKDTFGQLIFQHLDLKIFNTIPFLLFLIAHVKIYFIPFVSIMFPIFAYFLPYLLIKYVWRLPMSFQMYQNIMGKMWSFSLDMSPQKIIQNLFTCFTLLQSMYQPIQNAFHLHTIDSNIYSLGNAIHEYAILVKDLENFLEEKGIQYSFTQSLETSSNDSRRNFIYVLENPERLFFVSKDISKFEILWKISQNKEFEKVTFYSSNVPYFKGDNISDINLPKETRIGSSFMIDSSNNHFLLSGPNGGGKSSFLRGMLQTILFSQSFGYAVGTGIELAFFDYILSGLHIQDSPGKKSLFEKEVCFARDVLYYANSEYKGFVLFDEIFHSTNPPDGIRTSNEFLQKLWDSKKVTSIVSTHVFEIIDQSPSFIKKICVNAKRIDTVLEYEYHVSEGICKESSVEQIWNKNYAENGS